MSLKASAQRDFIEWLIRQLLNIYGAEGEQQLDPDVQTVTGSRLTGQGSRGQKGQRFTPRTSNLFVRPGQALPTIMVDGRPVALGNTARLRPMRPRHVAAGFVGVPVIEDPLPYQPVISCAVAEIPAAYALGGKLIADESFEATRLPAYVAFQQPHGEKLLGYFDLPIEDKTILDPEPSYIMPLSSREAASSSMLVEGAPDIEWRGELLEFVRYVANIFLVSAPVPYPMPYQCGWDARPYSVGFKRAKWTNFIFENFSVLIPTRYGSSIAAVKEMPAPLSYGVSATLRAPRYAVYNGYEMPLTSGDPLFLDRPVTISGGVSLNPEEEVGEDVFKFRDDIIETVGYRFFKAPVMNSYATGVNGEETYLLVVQANDARRPPDPFFRGSQSFTLLPTGLHPNEANVTSPGFDMVETFITGAIVTIQNFGTCLVEQGLVAGPYVGGGESAGVIRLDVPVQDVIDAVMGFEEGTGNPYVSMEGRFNTPFIRPRMVVVGQDESGFNNVARGPTRYDIKERYSASGSAGFTFFPEIDTETGTYSLTYQAGAGPGSTRRSYEVLVYDENDIPLDLHFGFSSNASFREIDGGIVAHAFPYDGDDRGEPATGVSGARYEGNSFVMSGLPERDLIMRKYDFDDLIPKGGIGSVTLDTFEYSQEMIEDTIRPQIMTAYNNETQSAEDAPMNPTIYQGEYGTLCNPMALVFENTWCGIEFTAQWYTADAYRSDDQLIGVVITEALEVLVSVDGVSAGSWDLWDFFPGVDPENPTLTFRDGTTFPPASGPPLWPSYHFLGNGFPYRDVGYLQPFRARVKNPLVDKVGKSFTPAAATCPVVIYLESYQPEEVDLES